MVDKEFQTNMLSGFFTKCGYSFRFNRDREWNPDYWRSYRESTFSYIKLRIVSETTGVATILHWRWPCDNQTNSIYIHTIIGPSYFFRGWGIWPPYPHLAIRHCQGQILVWKRMILRVLEVSEKYAATLVQLQQTEVKQACTKATTSLITTSRLILTQTQPNEPVQCTPSRFPWATKTSTWARGLADKQDDSRAKHEPVSTPPSPPPPLSTTSLHAPPGSSECDDIAASIQQIEFSRAVAQNTAKKRRRDAQNSAIAWAGGGVKTHERRVRSWRRTSPSAAEYQRWPPSHNQTDLRRSAAWSLPHASVYCGRPRQPSKTSTSINFTAQKLRSDTPGMLCHAYESDRRLTTPL